MCTKMRSLYKVKVLKQGKGVWERETKNRNDVKKKMKEISRKKKGNKTYISVREKEADRK